MTTVGPNIKRNHMRTEVTGFREVKKWHCEKCTATFSSYRNLRQHKEEVHSY